MKWKTIYNYLMYAADTILLAESEEDSQEALYAMFNHCNTWKLQVNVKKKNCIFFKRKDQKKSKVILRP